VNQDEVMIQAVNLSKRYEDGVLALDGLNLKVHAGEIYAMLGGNGAGKTTAIHLFLNFIEPTAGEVRIAGIDSEKDPLAAKEQVAFVSENVSLYPNFTAIQNIEYFTRIGGRTELARKNYEQVLTRVGLAADAFDKRLRGFSKGMRQKCGLAIAILKDAPAILLDEPTSGLDPKAGLEFVSLLEDLREEGKAILMSTHDLFRAKEVADRIGIMNNGVLVAERTREELRNENLEEIYVSYMAGYMDRFPARDVSKTPADLVAR
jgi:ABC-2 type transport system ATP-binding protein